MGTRGMVAVKAGRRELIAYNHFDSYPEGLGAKVAAYVRSLGTPELIAEEKAKVAAALLVDESAEPTPEQAERFAQFRQNVSTGRDWYSLLRDLQGDIGGYLDAGVWPNNGGRAWPRDSLFCEYGYYVDLNHKVLEFYRGFQTERHESGRFATDKAIRGYYPIALVRAYPFEQVRALYTDGVNSIVEAMIRDLGDED